MQKWTRDGASIGLRTDVFPVIDCDVTNERAANVIAGVIDRFFGKQPYRVGRAPKRAIVCRTAAPFSKIVLRLTAASGADLGKVEFLGRGNQAVLHGTHPVTLKPYEWFRGPSSGGAEVLAAVDPNALPELSPDIIARLTGKIQGALHGIGVRVSRAGDGKESPTPEQASLRAPSMEILGDVMAALPNDSEEREQYLETCFALKAAAGPENDAEGFEIWSAWCARWSAGFNTPEEVRERWDSAKGPFRLGFEYLQDRANLCDEFEVSEAPITQESAAEADSANYSDEERIAALHGSAERIFLADLSTGRQDTNWLDRFHELQSAAQRTDALGEVWQDVVIPEAIRWERTASEEPRFRSLMRSKLRGEPRWDALGVEDRRLLLRTAHVFAAPRSQLVLSSRGAGTPLGRENRSRDDLVAGWIPRVGVAALVGPPGVGKTHLLNWLACTVAKGGGVDPLTGEKYGGRFAGRDCLTGSVAYFPGEAVYGLAARRGRVEAAEGQLPDYVIFPNKLVLNSAEEAFGHIISALAEFEPGAAKLRLIILDTLRTSVIGDENSSEVIGNAMATASALSVAFDCAVVMAAHSNKKNSGDPRGSSAIEGALDWMGEVEANGDRFTVTVGKNREGRAGENFSWELGDDGVLRDANNSATTETRGLGERAMLTIAHAIRDVASSESPVTRTEFRTILQRNFKSLFGDTDTGAETQRLSRGLKDAIEAGFLKSEGKRNARFWPGDIEPPALPLEVASLEDVR